jgi:hypothetical protein
VTAIFNCFETISGSIRHISLTKYSDLVSTSTCKSGQVRMGNKIQYIEQKWVYVSSNFCLDLLLSNLHKKNSISNQMAIVYLVCDSHIMGIGVHYSPLSHSNSFDTNFVRQFFLGKAEFSYLYHLCKISRRSMIYLAFVSFACGLPLQKCLNDISFYL